MAPFSKIVLWVTIAVFLCLNAVQVFVFGVATQQNWALDTRALGYSAADARDFLDAIGVSGRAAFFGYYRWLDTLFPPMLAVSLILLFRQISGARSMLALGVFSLLPLGYLIADITENSFLKRLDSNLGFEAAVMAAQDATKLKYLVLGIAFLVLIGFTLFEKLRKN
ncbi:hypothetical protein [Planktotalea sp.]|uniref:hypothetical protein n=1 Tax=Planktotalea sp. TaxID=2029877 RepID=UPI003D69FFAA